MKIVASKRTQKTLLILFLAIILESILFNRKITGYYYPYSHETDSDLAVPNFTPNDVVERKLLLSVPFYVYEDLAWINGTFGGRSISEAPGGKHSNDFWFAKASLEHPLRTLDPAKAKLFVVPILMNAFDEIYFSKQQHGKKKNLCWNRICNKKLLKFAGRTLQNSPWFKNSSNLHIATTSHYVYGKEFWENGKPKELKDALYSMHAISYEDRKFNAPNRLSMPSYLVGTPCPLQENKLQQIGMIANLETDFEPNQHLFQDRRNICDWIRNKPNVSVSICGQGKQCPALASSKFGLHVRGDTFGSQRLMDTILSGTVPIFTRTEQYAIVPRWIDWSKISVFLNLSSEGTFSADLERILSDEGYEQKYKTLLANRELFHWKTLYPFDTYMYMLQAHIYPETRKLSSDWSVLLLPRQRTF